MSAIESLLRERRVFPPSPAVAAQANIAGMDAYRALVDEAERDYEGFWARLARQNLDWHTPFTNVLDESNAPFYTWFEDGKLNASYNCLDLQIIKGCGDKVAIVFESDDGCITRLSFQQLLERVCRFANALKSCGVRKGDRVAIYMPMSIEGLVAMQACARIGATHSVVFGGFSAKALNERLVDVGASILVTADEQRRGGRTLPLKSIADEALAMGDGAALKNVIVYRRTGGAVAWNSGRDLWMDELLEAQSDVCEPEWVASEHPLFILYTSGSTGKPKGVVHSTAGYLLWAAVTMKWTFDIKPDDVFWCTADIGWVTGHTYVAYGPLATGTTQIVFEGVPTYPDAGRYWDMVARHKATIFYTAPTAIRALIKASDEDPSVHPQKYDLSSLRLIGSVGEPISPKIWVWYYEQVGAKRCPIVDTWWQTEAGGHLIAPLPGATPLVPGSCALPLPGINAAIVDESGQDVPHGEGGMLVIKRPWPSMVRTIWGDAKRFKDSYFPQELGGGMFLAGDGSIRDRDTAYFTIMGRIDDVINVSGHRLGTMEIESALAANPIVAEAAVVAMPDDLTGEAVIAFVVLKGARAQGAHALQIANDLRAWVAMEIGPIAKPKEIRFGDNLPKTRSGKIVRRLLRALARGEAINQDVSTLENPAVLEQLSILR
ncbi:acetate--CoA ligase [Caballeronia sp. 15711]|uniref:acetate--CoA ligase n=1 Tax=Caballeronia sp. 15711 TaxID=3391029 RepID=UPI0039E4C99E